MVYKINGTELSLQPTSGRWVERGVQGFDGGGHPVYPAPREFELRWQLISATDSNQIQAFFNGVAATGTAVVDLPKYMESSYTFYSYSGCTLGEPSVGEFFQSHQSDLILIVHNIRTT